MKIFDSKLALTMAQLSAAAYIDAETSLAQRLNTLGFELVKEIGADDKEGGYICKCKDYAVLVFRGTHNKYEAILDLKVWHTHDDHVGYAEGFYAAYHKLLPQFVEFVDTAQIPVTCAGQGREGDDGSCGKHRLEGFRQGLRKPAS